MSYDVSLISTQTSLAQTSTSSTTSTAADEAATQKDLFLQILLTQLENQSPLDPVDTTEFTSQLTAYSSLEQQIDTNTKLDDMISLLNGNASFSALSYVGAEVEVTSDTSVVEDNTASWNYALADDASTVTVTVSDADGNVIEQNAMGSSTAGTYAFNFNATDYDLEEGAALYLTVSATDADGNNVTSTISSNVTVDAVETDGSGNITLQAGDYVFSADDVTSLRQTA